MAGTEHRHELSFPQGLFGFPEIKSMSLVYDHDELPFMWLREEEKKDGLAFIVIEPRRNHTKLLNRSVRR